MELKWLDGPEAAEELNPLIERLGWTPLNGSSNPVLTKARVSIGDDGNVQGFFVLQMMPMLGPVWVQAGADPELFRKLVADMRKFLADSSARGWLIIAANPRVADICWELGFTPETGAMFWGK